MGLRGVCICPTRSHALIGSIDHDGSLSANHWRRGHIASEDHGWFRYRPLIAGSRKLSLMMPGCYASLSHFRMKSEALRAVGIFFSQPSGSPIMAFTSPAMMVRIHYNADKSPSQVAHTIYSLARTTLSGRGFERPTSAVRSAAGSFAVGPGEIRP